MVKVYNSKAFQLISDFVKNRLRYPAMIFGSIFVNFSIPDALVKTW
jgi:hypothetical protein